MMVFCRFRSAPIQNNSGFTLVELLISLVIFSLLSLSATISLSLIGDIVRRTDLNYAEQTRVFSVLQDSLKSTFSYVGQKKDYMSNRLDFYNYFYGSPHEITFVSTRGQIYDGLVMAHVYQRESSLYMEETRLYDLNYAYLSPDLNERAVKPLLLANDVKKFDVRYFTAQKWRNKSTEQFPELIEIVLETERRSLTVKAALGSRFDNRNRSERLSVPY